MLHVTQTIPSGFGQASLDTRIYDIAKCEIDGLPQFQITLIMFSQFEFESILILENDEEPFVRFILFSFIVDKMFLCDADYYRFVFNLKIFTRTTGSVPGRAENETSCFTIKLHVYYSGLTPV